MLGHRLRRCPNIYPTTVDISCLLAPSRAHLTEFFINFDLLKNHKIQEKAEVALDPRTHFRVFLGFGEFF